MNAARSLDQALADSLLAIEEQGATLANCLARHSERRSELEKLLALAQDLRAAPAVAPSPGFRASSRRRLEARLRAARPTPVPPRSWRDWLAGRQSANIRRPALVWASLLLLAILVLGGGGAVYAAADALPGDALYTLKTGLEEARLAATKNDLGEGQLHLELANRRLREINALIAAGRDHETTLAIWRYLYHMNAAQVIAESAAEDDTRDALAAQLLSTLAAHELTLTRNLRQAPSGALPALQNAQAALSFSRTSVQNTLLLASRDPVDQMALYLRFADDQLLLASSQAALGQDGRASFALLEYSRHIGLALAHLMTAPDDPAQQALATRLSAALSRQTTVLDLLEPQAGQSLRTALEQARRVNDAGRYVLATTP